MRFCLPQTWGERSGYVLTAFLLGIAVRSLDPLRSWAMFLPALVGFMGVCLVGMVALRGHARFIAYCLFALCTGLARFELSVPTMRDGVLPWLGQTVTVTGRVVDVQHASFGTSVLVEVSTVEGGSVRGPGDRLRLMVSRSSHLAPGDGVSVACGLGPTVDTAQKPIQRRLLARQGIWAVCGRAHLTILSWASRLRPDILLASWRAWLTARIDASMPADEARLLAGILYGERGMSPELQDDFRTAGLMHIIAVSGSNVSILNAVVFAALLAVGLSRRHAFWHMSFALLVFVLFVGGSASVLRAAFMAWFALFGRYLGRLVSTRRLLVVSAFLLCLWDPWQLIYDIGFGLSFLATLGLLEILPRLEPRLVWLPQRFGIRESVATTLATTILTAPYGALVFDRMPLAGLMTNIFALPLVPWAMLFGAISAVLGPHVPGFLHWPARGCLDLLILIGRASRYLPWLDIRW